MFFNSDHIPVFLGSLLSEAGFKTEAKKKRWGLTIPLLKISLLSFVLTSCGHACLWPHTRLEPKWEINLKKVSGWEQEWIHTTLSPPDPAVGKGGVYDQVPIRPGQPKPGILWSRRAQPVCGKEGVVVEVGLEAELPWGWQKYYNQNQMLRVSYLVEKEQGGGLTATVPIPSPHYCPSLLGMISTERYRKEADLL